MQEGSGAQYCHSVRGAAGEFPLGGPFIGVDEAEGSGTLSSLVLFKVVHVGGDIMRRGTWLLKITPIS